MAVINIRTLPSGSWIWNNKKVNPQLLQFLTYLGEASQVEICLLEGNNLKKKNVNWMQCAFIVIERNLLRFKDGSAYIWQVYFVSEPG